MSKRILVAIAVLAISAPFAAADVGNTNPNDIVGVFNYNADIGGPEGIGFTMDMGVGITPNLGDERQYLITGGGADIWGNKDEFHYAYNLVSGDLRLSADLDWQAAQNGWAKMGVMLRPFGFAGNEIEFFSGTQKDQTKTIFAFRENTGGGSGDQRINDVDASNTTFGIQRIDAGGGWTVIQGLFDRNEGAGWEVRGTKIAGSIMGGEIMAGVAVTSHDDGGLAQAIVTNVMYETEDIGIIGDLGLPTVTGAGPDVCSDIPGFLLRVKKKDPGQEWNYVEATRLLNGEVPGDILDWDLLGEPGWNPNVGVRLDPVVNLTQDDTDQGAFGNDSHFPGIDLIKEQGVHPDDADDDNDFATEAIACIYLTEGIHKIGANSDDGTIIEIGGVEIGRTAEWKGASNVDFTFLVAEEGWYDFRAQSHEGGGGASFELHEIFSDGTRILLGQMNDQGAFIGSPVYAPEPATIALLGLGGLSLLRRKRS